MKQRERSGPGRPREFDRPAALLAAMHTFWRRGYTETSASDLAQAMGIGRSSFYNAFGDKDAVFREARDLYLDQAPDAALARLAPDEPLLPALWQVFRELCRVRSSDPEARGCLMVRSIAELAGRDTPLSRETEETTRARITALERLLRRAERAAELAPLPDRRACATSIVTLLCGINVMSQVVREEQALWRVCRATLTGLGIPERRSRRR